MVSVAAVRRAVAVSLVWLSFSCLAGCRDGEADTDSGLPGVAESGLPCVANMESDPMNCGTCGHICLNGSCEAGVCFPRVLVTAPDGISSFAIDATTVYWTTSYTSAESLGPEPVNGTVSKCPLSGCSGTVTSLATGQMWPESIWVAGGSVFWLNYNAGAIMQCSLDCNNDPSTFYGWSSPLGNGGFATNGTEAFVAVPQSPLIRECPTTGCTAPSTFAWGQANPVDIVLGDAGVFWVNLGTLLVEGNLTEVYVDGGIMTCPASGCDGGPTPITTGVSYPTNLIVAGASVYWGQGSSVLSCSIDGCGGSPTALVSLPESDEVSGVAADSANVYFGDMNGSFGWEIRRCSLNGCPDGSLLLAAGAASSGRPAQVTVDDTSVYFILGGRNTSTDEIVAVSK